MSTPAPPAPLFGFELTVTCANCNKVVHTSLSSSEQQFKEESAKAVTASELHDCRGGPKK